MERNHYERQIRTSHRTKSQCVNGRRQEISPTRRQVWTEYSTRNTADIYSSRVGWAGNRSWCPSPRPQHSRSVMHYGKSLRSVVNGSENRSEERRVGKEG